MSHVANEMLGLPWVVFDVLVDVDVMFVGCEQFGQSQSRSCRNFSGAFLTELEYQPMYRDLKVRLGTMAELMELANNCRADA